MSLAIFKAVSALIYVFSHDSEIPAVIEVMISLFWMKKGFRSMSLIASWQILVNSKSDIIEESVKMAYSSTGSLNILTSFLFLKDSTNNLAISFNNSSAR